jgi:hypothetical protein
MILSASQNEVETPPQPHQRRNWGYRWSLRTLMIAMAVIGLLLSWAGSYWRNIRREQWMVEQIQAAGGQVTYNYEFGGGEELHFRLDSEEDPTITGFQLSGGKIFRKRATPDGEILEAEIPSGPEWAKRALGQNALSHVERVVLPCGENGKVKLEPGILVSLPELKLIAACDQYVSDAALAQYAKVRQLRILRLGDGRATAKGLSHLSTAQHLEALGVGGPWLDDHAAKGLESLHQLRSLAINDGTNVTTACLVHIAKLKNLEDISFFRVPQFEDEGTEPFASLRNLRQISFFQTPIGNATVSHLSKLTELEVLSIHDAAAVGDEGVSQLAGLPRIRKLRLRGTTVGDTGIQAIAKLPLLIELDLEGTRVTDGSVAAISQMTSLERLSLYLTDLSDAGLPALASLKNLKSLDIGPHISIKAANQLRDALPECRISRFNSRGSAGYPEVEGDDQ